MNKDNYNVMDLFAGIGGASYAGKLIGNWRTVCYVEWDKYCQEVIKQRIKDGIFDDAPIWGDIRNFNGKPWFGKVDIITAGFPCQPFSAGGKQLEGQDSRNMWPETIRIIREVQPEFAFMENVSGLIGLGYFGKILGDLCESGYYCRWRILSAAELGAPHKRDRIWLVAHTKHARRTGLLYDNDESNPWPTWIKEATALDSQRRIFQAMEKRLCESSLLRTNDGFPNQIKRLGAIGNAWVPHVAATAWKLLTN